MHLLPTAAILFGCRKNKGSIPPHPQHLTTIFLKYLIPLHGIELSKNQFHNGDFSPWSILLNRCLGSLKVKKCGLRPPLPGSSDLTLLWASSLLRCQLETQSKDYKRDRMIVVSRAWGSPTHQYKTVVVMAALCGCMLRHSLLFVFRALV
jgi:hypothetical protein